MSRPCISCRPCRSRDLRAAAHVAVRQDVGGLEQRGLPQPAHGALAVVGGEDQTAEALLVEPLLDQAGGVGLERGGGEGILLARGHDVPAGVGEEKEGELAGIVADHVAGEHRVVEAAIDRPQVEHRPAKLPGAAEGDVVGVGRVGAPVPIHQAVVAGVEPVVVGALERGLDGERGAGLPEERRPEDAPLLAPDGDPLAPEHEALVQGAGGDRAAGLLAQAGHVIEQREAQLEVEVEHGWPVPSILARPGWGRKRGDGLFPAGCRGRALAP